MATRSLANLYLDLLKQNLLRWGEDELVPVLETGPRWKDIVRRLAKRGAAAANWELVDRLPFNAERRQSGRDWPASALTMIGMKRLDNLQFCIETIIRDKVAGDLVETGVWRGGASIFMRAALEALGDEERIVWCADSFAGLPAPDTEKYIQDKDVTWHLAKELAVPLAAVQANFKKFGFLDERVKFLVGWFKDTLPSAPISAVSILRLDGDMYESTMDALNALYVKVSPSGFIVVDDYGIPEDTCRRAITDFRDRHGITEPIIDIDGFGAYWRKA